MRLYCIFTSFDTEAVFCAFPQEQRSPCSFHLHHQVNEEQQQQQSNLPSKNVVEGSIQFDFVFSDVIIKALCAQDLRDAHQLELDIVSLADGQKK